VTASSAGLGYGSLLRTTTNLLLFLSLSRRLQGASSVERQMISTSFVLAATQKALLWQTSKTRSGDRRTLLIT
jgi:hypothetical protein